MYILTRKQRRESKKPSKTERPYWLRAHNHPLSVQKLFSTSIYNKGILLQIPLDCIVYLQSWLSVLDQILKVRLVPCTRLRRRCVRIGHTTERIITGGRRVTRTI
jgi:hypothetical protein